MGFLDDVAEVAGRADTRKLAFQRAGSSARAEDAIQETILNVAGTANPEAIHDLPAYFRRALVREINHVLARPVPTPIDDIDATGELAPDHGSWPGSRPAPSVETQAVQRLLAEQLLRKLDRDFDQLTASVSARSSDPKSYQTAIVMAAGRILSWLLMGHVTRPDWNTVLKSVSPLWCDEPGLERDALDQRLSRARHDVQELLRMVTPRAQLDT